MSNKLGSTVVSAKMRRTRGAMRVETIEDRGVRILHCSGRMMRDGSDERLIGACDAVLENGARLVIDLREAAWMDSSGVGALVACAKHAAERGAFIKVALPEDGPVRKVFKLCHLDRVFDTFRDVATAVASYRP